jgi:mannitol/fructose-specific phosphotransferase system IIA component (Ntr-type)
MLEQLTQAGNTVKKIQDLLNAATKETIIQILCGKRDISMQF